MLLPNIFLYVCFLSLLVLASASNGGSSTIDLIHKVYYDASFVEAIVTTSLPCCTLNITLDTYNALTPPVETAASDALLEDEMPFIWIAHNYVEADFLQIDLRTVFQISSVHKRSVQDFPTMEDVACEFSIV